MKSAEKPYGNLRAMVLSLLVTLAACQFAPQQTGAANGSKDREVPAAAQATFAQALTAQRAQQWTEAERLHRQLAEKYPQLSGPHFNLALIYAQTNRAQLAEESFRRALQTNPENLDASDQYAIWLRSQARFAEAETQYRQTLARDPTRTQTHLDLTILYDLYMGNLPAALEHYQRHLELSGNEESPVHGWVLDLQRRLSAG